MHIGHICDEWGMNEHRFAYETRNYSEPELRSALDYVTSRRIRHMQTLDELHPTSPHCAYLISAICNMYRFEHSLKVQLSQRS